MNYIFVVQGEGRGHLTQALAMSQLLRKNGHSIEKVLVGRCRGREIPQFFISKIEAPVMMYDSPTLDYGQNGKSTNILKTLFQNTTPIKLNRFRKSVDLIHDTIEQSGADVVINFYEFLLGVTNILRPLHRPIVSIGHQFLVDHPQFDHRAKFDGGLFMLKVNNLISSYGSYKRLALSFYPKERSFSPRVEVVPPLLRNEIFELKTTEGVEGNERTEGAEGAEGGYLLGYMLNPGYLKEVVKWKRNRENEAVQVHLFWDKVGAKECEEYLPGLWLHTLDDKKFLEYMAGAKGYITTAGFESVCEAMYMGKPVVMIPAHVEQEINAKDAHSVGAGIIAEEFDLSLLREAIKNYSADTQQFREWVQSAEEVLLRAVTML